MKTFKEYVADLVKMLEDEPELGGCGVIYDADYVVKTISDIGGEL